MDKETKRLTLTIGQVGEKKPIGDKGTMKLPFKASVEGKEASYFTFSTRCMEHIKIGEVFDADVEISQREYEGNIYTDRKVVQIYKEGEPVAEKKQWQQRGNPEERSSIEEQVAIKSITDRVVANIKVRKDLMDALDDWCLAKLKNYIKPIQKPEPVEVKTVETKTEELPSFKSPTEFITYCQDKFGTSATVILNNLGVHKVTEIKDYKQAYQKLVEALK